MRPAVAVLALLALTFSFTPAVAQEGQDARAAWSLVAAGADGRSLKLVYEAGGCSRGDGRAVVTETNWEIHVEVRHTVAQADACPANSIAKAVTARLDAPIEGRFVTGSRGLGPLPVDSYRVPRVLGLSQPDAARVLGERGHHVRTRGLYTAGKVVSQRPRAGTRLRGRRTVTLRMTYARR